MFVKKRFYPLCLFLAFSVLLSACTETQYVAHLAKQIPIPSDTPKSAGYYKVGNSYEVKGKRYYPKESFDYVETGIASWYGPNFHGKKTANGEVFNKYELTAAHKTLQMPSLVRVTNLENGKSLVVRVNDRGPYAHNRIIDLSERAAELLGYKKQGTARVKLEVLSDESRVLAQVAKRGESTAGLEVAYNRDGRLPLSATRHVNIVRTDKTPTSPEDAAIIWASAKPVAPVTAQPIARQSVYPSQQREYARFEDVIDNYGSGNGSGNSNGQKIRQAQAFPRNEIEAMALPEGQVLPTRKPLTRKSVANMSDVIAGHSQNGRFMPDPIVQQLPVQSTSLYVQAGSFTSFDNAQTLKLALGHIGPITVQTAQVKGRTFHRVRIGPYSSVAEADRVMSALEQKGRVGTIVVVD